LSIPSPTFTGTETFPDAATWTSSGISKAAALSVGSATLPAGGNVSISGAYQINGTQISATSALSDGKTGTGALAGSIGPTISGNWAGNATFSGNIVHSGQLSATGTSAPASAGGQVYVMGTIAVPTLSNTGQGAIYDTVVGGLMLQGDGSTSDFTLANKAGTTVFTVPTGTAKLNFPGLVSGTCSSGLALDSGGNLVEDSCPGAAAAIQVGTTTVNSGTNNFVLTAGAGTLANVTEASLLTAGTGITITGTTTATIAVTAPVSVSATIAVPSQTTSTTFVQMGLGTSCKFTPTQTGTVLIFINGTLTNNTISDVTRAELTYGTGTAPSNGAAQTGTAIAVTNNFSALAANAQTPSTLAYVISGLSLSTAYWFDAAVDVNAGTGGYSGTNVGCSAFELP
jgi:hypothetical protein